MQSCVRKSLEVEITLEEICAIALFFTMMVSYSELLDGSERSCNVLGTTGIQSNSSLPSQLFLLGLFSLGHGHMASFYSSDFRKYDSACHEHAIL